jgi:hypothetical protein
MHQPRFLLAESVWGFKLMMMIILLQPLISLNRCSMITPMMSRKAFLLLKDKDLLILLVLLLLMSLSPIHLSLIPHHLLLMLQYQCLLHRQLLNLGLNSSSYLCWMSWLILRTKRVSWDKQSYFVYAHCSIIHATLRLFCRMLIYLQIFLKHSWSCTLKTGICTVKYKLLGLLPLHSYSKGNYGCSYQRRLMPLQSKRESPLLQSFKSC